MLNNLNEKHISMKVIGVGGAGNNAINLILDEQKNWQNIELYVANTDSQDLEKSRCNNKIFLGSSTRGLGAGNDPNVGQQCAIESLGEIQRIVSNTDIVVIATGLGGGTGTGASPVIAKTAKEAGALTIAIVTTPFKLEGKTKSLVANKGLENLKKYVDAFIVLSNQKLISLYSKLPIIEAFKVANITLKQSIKVIHDTIFETGYINVDFNDLKRVLLNGNDTIISIGTAYGKERAKKAITEAFSAPLFEKEVKGAKKMIVLFQCDRNTNLEEIELASEMIDELMHIENDEMEKIIGFQLFDNQEDFFQVNIIASNIKNEAPFSTSGEFNRIQNMSNTSIFNMQNAKNVEFKKEQDKDSVPNFFKN
ncbi:cell division protein FtsZ [Mycoplasmopsis hyopharyngis]|uniref:cell division protein FtsZ n=1 Tax=Mycoplasmopsis hyopharyngis TaxID=29558 RepID=UPI003872E3C1